jgi:8-hydroxy-5-deazaflavin:NADPH oxidoreductase
METAIVGLGNIGSRLAKNLTDGGASVIISDRGLGKARELAANLGGKARPMPIEEALQTADVVILAIYFQAIKEFILEHRDALAGKIVVDPSNPIAPDGAGGFKKIVPQEESSGEIIAGLAPEGAMVVKAFGTLSAESLGSAAHRSPEPAALFYATDHPEAGKAIEGLIAASGFAPVNIGGIDQSIRIEVGGDLHEMGKLGKVVSAKQARALVSPDRQ